MEIRAYVYLESHTKKFCFKCAVKEIIAKGHIDLNLALGAGPTGDGNDMRSIPRCDVCGKCMKDFYVA